MDSQSLTKLLKSIENNINIDDFYLKFMVFMNKNDYIKPIIKVFNSEIIYLPLNDENYMKIHSARTYLHNNIYKYCKEQEIEPIIWLLDEDMEIDKRANNYLNKLHPLKKQYDVLIGSIEGDSPNSAFSGINVQLQDLIYNLNYLDTLNDDDLFPNHEKHNQTLREKYQDYYYDLSSSHLGHLKAFFYLLPINNQEKVFSVRKRIFLNLDNIISGLNIFRPIENKKIDNYNETLLRGGNTFILNIETLKIENPIIKINNRIMRRSDMLWALINKEFLNKKIVKTDFVVKHNRGFDIEKELNISKTIQENGGSVIFNALKIYYEKNIEQDFKNILNERVDSKADLIAKNYNNIIDNIKILEDLKKPELHMFIEKLNKFYNEKNKNLIINNLQSIKDESKNIFNQFISCKPLILGSCFLEREDANLHQYNIGNDDIKIITKIPIEEIDTSEPVVIRMHSSCCNSEVFGAIDCDCASQLDEYMKMIEKTDNSILLPKINVKYIQRDKQENDYSLGIIF